MKLTLNDIMSQSIERATRTSSDDCLFLDLFKRSSVQDDDDDDDSSDD